LPGFLHLINMQKFLKDIDIITQQPW